MVKNCKNCMYFSNCYSKNDEDCDNCEYYESMYDEEDLAEEEYREDLEFRGNVYREIVEEYND